MEAVSIQCGFSGVLSWGRAGIRRTARTVRLSPRTPPGRSTPATRCAPHSRRSFGASFVGVHRTTRSARRSSHPLASLAETPSARPRSVPPSLVWPVVARPADQVCAPRVMSELVVRFDWCDDHASPRVTARSRGQSPRFRRSLRGTHSGRLALLGFRVPLAPLAGPPFVPRFARLHGAGARAASGSVFHSRRGVSLAPSRALTTARARSRRWSYRRLPRQKPVSRQVLRRPRRFAPHCHYTLVYKRRADLLMKY